jgi:16S rRNA (cytosine967-C5)-methyltransferase
MINSKKKPQNARELALDVLIRVEQEKSYSNLELNDALKRSRLESVDAGLATELVYGTIQRKGTLDWILGQFLKQGLSKLETWVLNLLRMSLYQIWFLDRIPERAAIHEGVEIAKKRGHKGISGMVNGVLRNIVRQKSDIRFPENQGANKRIALEHSHPEWMVERWINLFGEHETEEICKQNNIPPKISIRVNTLRMTRDRLLQAMVNEGIEAVPSSIHPAGILIQGGGNIGQSRWFQDGFCTIQDESSMLVGQLLSPKSGSKVLDCCAAPGGKTTHLAELMGNDGTIIAADLHRHKIDLIRSNMDRLGTGIIQPILADARELHKQLNVEGGFDFILLDAPCSGLGVIRRKPDIKWTKTLQDVEAIVHLQEAIIDSAGQLVKPDGVLVYSTCTLDPAENEQIIERFLKKYPEFYLDTEASRLLPESVVQKAAIPNRLGMFRILPHMFGSDGFFMARLVKRSAKL